MKKKSIPFDFQNKIRKYIDSIYDGQYNNTLIEHKLIDQLSASLKQGLLLRANRGTIDRFPFLNDNFSEDVLKKLTLALRHKTYFPEEVIIKVLKKNSVR